MSQRGIPLRRVGRYEPELAGVNVYLDCGHKFSGMRGERAFDTRPKRARCRCCAGKCSHIPQCSVNRGNTERG